MPSLSRTALSLLFASFTAEVAATRAYLRIDDIEGEAQTPGFRDWIEIERYTPGLPRGEEAVTGTGSNRPVRHGPFIIRKALDRASPFLAAAAVRQRRFAEVEIQHPAADTTAGALLAHFRLHDVRLEEVSLATPPADGRSHEEWAFHARSIEWHFGADEAHGGPVGTQFDFPRGIGGLAEAGHSARPQISPLGPLAALPGETPAVPIGLPDADPSPDKPFVEASSSDPSLVQVMGLRGNGETRTLELRAGAPARGSASIFIWVSDGRRSSSRTLPVVVGGGPASPFELYLTGTFGIGALERAPALALPLGDPDNDRLTTLLEYHLGTHANTLTSLADAFQIRRLESSEDVVRLRVRYHRRSDLAGLVGRFEGSLDGEDWYPLGAQTSPRYRATVQPIGGSPFEAVDAVLELKTTAPVFVRYRLEGTFQSPNGGRRIVAPFPQPLRACP